MKNIIIKDGESGVRLDRFLVKKISGYSRASIQNMIINNYVLVNNRIIKPSYLLKAGDHVRLTIEKKLPVTVTPEEGQLKKVYEDRNLIILDKPNDLTVHPTPNKTQGTLVNILISSYPEIAEATFDQKETSKIRPGIVHRLDKDTSGLMIVAKNKINLKYLSEEFKKHRVKKIYRALVYGWPRETGELKSNIKRDPKQRVKMAEGLDGKPAISAFKTEKYFQTNDNKKVALVRIEIKTGRTHQIRLQFKNSGHPILGDETYNTKESRLLSKRLGINRQMLHSSKISFHSIENSIITKSSELPKDIKSVFERLKIISD